MTEEIRHPFTIVTHAIGHRGIQRNRRVVCLERCDKAVKGDSGVSSFVVGLGGYEAFDICGPCDFNSLQKVT